MDNDNVHIDYSALMEMMKNIELNKFILNSIGLTGNDKDFAFRFLTAANRHGVSTETVLKILTDIIPRGEDGYIKPDEDNDSVTPY